MVTVTLKGSLNTGLIKNRNYHGYYWCSPTPTERLAPLAGLLSLPDVVRAPLLAANHVVGYFETPGPSKTPEVRNMPDVRL